MAATTFLPLLDERGDLIGEPDTWVPIVRNARSRRVHLREGLRRPHCLCAIAIEPAGELHWRSIGCSICRSAVRRLRPMSLYLANRIWRRLCGIGHDPPGPEALDTFALSHFPPWPEWEPDWPRLLVLADWWDEQGDPRGEALRVEAELAQGLAGTARRFCQLLARRAELYDQMVGW